MLGLSYLDGIASKQNIQSRITEHPCQTQGRGNNGEKACMGCRIEPQLTLIITWPCCLATMCCLNWDFQTERGGIN